MNRYQSPGVKVHPAQRLPPNHPHTRRAMASPEAVLRMGKMLFMVSLEPAPPGRLFDCYLENGRRWPVPDGKLLATMMPLMDSWISELMTAVTRLALRVTFRAIFRKASAMKKAIGAHGQNQQSQAGH